MGRNDLINSPDRNVFDVMKEMSKAIPFDETFFREQMKEIQAVAVSESLGMIWWMLQEFTIEVIGRIGVIDEVDNWRLEVLRILINETSIDNVKQLYKEEVYENTFGKN